MRRAHTCSRCLIIDVRLYIAKWWQDGLKLTLGVGTESDLTAAASATDIEPEDWNRQVSFIESLLARIELATLGNVLAAVSAFHRVGCHQADRGQLG